MNQRSILTRADYMEFLRCITGADVKDEISLIKRVFGSGYDYVGYAIRRSFTDLTSQLKMQGKKPIYMDLRERGVEEASLVLDDLLRFSKRVNNQAPFDTWHKASCLRLSKIFQDGNQPLTFAQIQQVMNLSFKYIYTMGDSYISGYATIYSFCHAPMEKIFINQLTHYGFPNPPDFWSRLEDYAYYLDCQKWIREHFNLPPLDVEFFLWLGKSVEPKEG